MSHHCNLMADHEGHKQKQANPSTTNPSVASSNRKTTIAPHSSIMEPHPTFYILPLVQYNPDHPEIEISKIQNVCVGGLGSCPPEDRAIAWLVLSHIFPLNPEKWTSARSGNRELYLEYVDMFNLSGYENENYAFDTSTTFFREGIDNKLMELIHVDVLRTYHHIHILPFPDNTVKVTSEETVLGPFHNQMRRIERVLYLFASLNRTVSYLQGFNEIAAVFYYTFSSSLPYFSNDFEEMESFVFTSLQTLFGSTKFGELYTLQDRSSIIHHRMTFFVNVLQNHFPEAYKIIMKHNIHPLCFCFRWMSLLFAQEYLIPDLLLIWDALYAHFDELVDYATYIAVAHVKMLESEISIDDYIATMTALTKGKVDNVPKLLNIAKQYWDEDHNTSIFGKFKKMVNKLPSINLPQMNLNVLQQLQAQQPKNPTQNKNPKH